MSNNKNSRDGVKINYFSTDHLIPTLRKRAIRGASVTVIIQICNFFTQMTSTIIMARLLTPRDFGMVTMVLSFSLLLQSLGCNGFAEVIIQRKDITHRQTSNLFWINVALSAILMLVFLLFAPVISWFYNEPQLKPIVWAIAVSILFGGLSNQHLGLLTRNMEFFKVSVTEMVATIVSATVAIVLAYRGWGHWSLVSKWTISPLIVAVGAWILCGWRPGFPARDTETMPMLRFAFNTYGNFVMNYYRRNMDKMLIGWFHGSQQLGFYDRAYQLSNMLPNQLVSPITNVALSTFSRASNDPKRYRNNYLSVLSVLAFVSMPLSAVLALISNDVVLLLLGAQWKEAGHIFLAFGASIGVVILYNTHGWLHLSLGKPERWFRWSFFAFIVTAISFIVGIPFGALGVAVAYSATFYILIGPALWYAGRPVNLNLFSVLSCLWKYYMAALFGWLICWFLLYSYNSTATIYLNLNIIVRIVVAFVLCISIYLIIIVMLYKSVKPISNFITILRELTPTKKSVA